MMHGAVPAFAEEKQIFFLIYLTCHHLTQGSRNGSSSQGPEWSDVSLSVIPDAGTCLKQIQEMNFECAMVIRNGARAELALNKLERLKAFCRREAKEFREGDDVAGLDVSCRLRAALYLSECLMKAVRLRKESRGSHYRWDYPEKKEKFSKRILSVWDLSLIHI